MAVIAVLLVSSAGQPPDTQSGKKTGQAASQATSPQPLPQSPSPGDVTVFGLSLGGLVCLILVAFVVVAFSPFVWSLPIWIAYKRKHPHFAAIAVLAATLGWTYLGWSVALIWSVMGIDADKRYR